MKHRRLVLYLLCALTISAAQAAVKIDKIEPAQWFCGMKNPSLQLMVYGEGIRSAEVSIDYPGVSIDSLVRLDSPNYLFIYLNIKDAQPGTMKLTFTQQGSKKYKQTIDYPLLCRQMKGEERLGFDNSDVLYMLMPDRFADGDPSNNIVQGMESYTIDRQAPSLRHGGDLKGIAQHLDYFTDLGVTALWFTPVLENNAPDEQGFSAYHGYATTDYYNVDRRLGTNDEYRQLVEQAHDRGIKIVMDMIFNHCSSSHPWLKDLPAHDWLNLPQSQTSYKLTPIVDPYASDIDKSETVDGWFVPAMPDLNQRNPHLLTYLIQNSFWWIETVGINGIRMDTYPYADAEAMAQWMRELNEEYPNFNVVGETWVTEPAYTASYQKDSKFAKVNSELKTVMDFSFFEKINQAKKEETDQWWEGYNRIYNSLVYDYLYPNPSSVMAFIENHDTDRFLENGQDILSLQQALALLLTMNRIPQLYYGTEVLMNGTKEITDGFVRNDFPGGFPDDPHDCFTADGRTAEQNTMFVWLSNLLHWRKGNDVISQGSQKQFIPYNGVYVLARQKDDKTVMTIINGQSKEGLLSVEHYRELIGNTHSATDILTHSTVALDEDLPLSPRQALVLVW